MFVIRATLIVCLLLAATAATAQEQVPIEIKRFPGIPPLLQMFLRFCIRKTIKWLNIEAGEGMTIAGLPLSKTRYEFLFHGLNAKN